MQRKLNWRLILVHGIAFFFIIRAFQSLTQLANLKILKLVNEHHEQLARIDQIDIRKYLLEKGGTVLDIAFFHVSTHLSGILGGIAAFIISLVVCRKRNWTVLHPIIILVSFYLLSLPALGFRTLSKPVFVFATSNTAGLVAGTIIGGLLYLLIGLLLIFRKGPRQFIEKGWRLRKNNASAGDQPNNHVQ